MAQQENQTVIYTITLKNSNVLKVMLFHVLDKSKLVLKATTRKRLMVGYN
jgi:hypothetical protein